MAKKKKTTWEKASDDAQNLVLNSLSQALFGLNPYCQGQMISQQYTIEENLRWYLISNNRQTLSQAYSELGVLQAAVDVPVDDALKGGIQVKTKELDDDDLQMLYAEMEQEDDLYRAGLGEKWKRLFGGGGIVIITDQDPEEELDLDAIKEDSELEFRAVDMWELYWTRQDSTDYAQAIDTFDYAAMYYDYYGQTLHESRVIKMKGKEAASLIRPRLRGWGVSIVETMVRSINQYLKATALSFEVLDEFKLDIYKIKGLSQAMLTTTGTNAIQKRLQIANAQKNFQNALAMDSEDDFMNKELSFAGLAETMEGIRMQLAADLRMPMSKLFGIPSTGFSSGEDDIENYNAMINSTIRPGLKKAILKMVGIRCQKMFGFIPEDLQIEFEPLRELSAEQEENVKTQKFNRIELAFARGALPLDKYIDACNKYDLLGVQLDPTKKLMDNRLPGEKEGDDAEIAVKKQKSKINKVKEAKT